MSDYTNTQDPYSHTDLLNNLWNKLKVDFQIVDADNVIEISLASVLETPVRHLQIDGKDYYVDKNKYVYRKETNSPLSLGKSKADFLIGTRIGQFLKN